jgi:hypothetical protein
MSDGKAVPAKVDLLGVLDAWVDMAEAPDTLMQVPVWVIFDETSMSVTVAAFCRCKHQGEYGAWR